jgi:putative endonuclease
VKKLGAEAEALAAAYLVKIGYKIIAQNINYRFGELDIIAFDKQTLVFIEVKHRRSQSYGAPYEAVTRSKQHKIILAAQAYLQKYSKNMPVCRFDVVSLVGDLKSPHLEHIRDAFLAEGF